MCLGGMHHMLIMKRCEAMKDDNKHTSFSEPWLMELLFRSL